MKAEEVAARRRGRRAMNRPSAIGERSVALFLLGLLLFSPPLMSLFDGLRFVAGIPVLYLYLFCAWAGILVLLRIVTAKATRPRAERVPGPGLQTGGER